MTPAKRLACRRVIMGCSPLLGVSSAHERERKHTVDQCEDKSLPEAPMRVGEAGTCNGDLGGPYSEPAGTTFRQKGARI